MTWIYTLGSLAISIAGSIILTVQFGDSLPYRGSSFIPLGFFPIGAALAAVEGIVIWFLVMIVLFFLGTSKRAATYVGVGTGLAIYIALMLHPHPRPHHVYPRTTVAQEVAPFAWQAVPLFWLVARVGFAALQHEKQRRTDN
ncbi:MAG TPA: hypothetical protein VF787_17030 [Thermoanaerobaculia bacterium]